MDISHLVTFNLALLVAIVSPGPALLIAMQNSLSSGKWAGIATGAGLGVVGALWTAIALLGMDVIFATAPWAYLVIKTIGASYLLYVAYCMWRGACTTAVADVKPKSHAFRQGMAINALNPKTVLFAAAILAPIFPSNLTVSENLAIIANHFIFEIAFYSALASGVSRKAVRDGYFAAKFYIDRIGAIALGGLGAKLLLSK